MNKKTLLFIVISCIFSFLFIYMGFVPSKDIYPKEVYRVYLGSQSLGIIESADELANYIDEGQDDVKQKYKVDKVYAPVDLKLQKEITYDEKLSSIEYIYNRILDESPFTVNGYEITIGSVEVQNEDGTKYITEPVTIYVLDKQVFLDSINNTIKSFVNPEQYDAFLNNRQKEIVDVGTILEDVYIKNEITCVEKSISVNENIYTNSQELSKFLIYGTTAPQNNYTVLSGDTIETVSFNNKISTEEFLIANPNFKTSKDLLFPGQIVTLGILDPQVRVIEESHVVEYKTISYETEYQNDDTKYVGTEEVIQEGVDGKRIVTEKIEKQNGEALSIIVTNSVDVEKPVNKVIVRGTKIKQTYTTPTIISDDIVVPVDLGGWGWPGMGNTYVSSPYAWRWGKLHEGIDIVGSGYGSPLYADNNGIVVYAGWRGGGSGETVWIKHANGWYSTYSHMSGVAVSAGQIVYTGDQVGTMGQSGYAFGTHLHFAMWYGKPFAASSFNPCNVLACR